MLSEITGIKWKLLQLKPVKSCDKSKWRIMAWTIMSCFPNQYMMLIEIDEMYIFTRVNSEHLNLAYIYIYIYMLLFSCLSIFCATEDKIW